ncbi:hypothetical protein ASG90_20600 [Nocardioides sp. Soil797]|nr:hypothetical protein ASG90_20600 [Nocardioides sp. Soil797]
MTDANKDEQVERLICLLEHDVALVEPSLQRVWRELPAYEAVPREQLMSSVQRNLGLACRTLRAKKVPPAEEIWQAERVTLERLQAGLPIEDIMAGFRVSITAIQDRLIEIADDLGVDAVEVVVLTRLLWKLSDAFSARAAAAYRQHGLAVAVADQRRRDEWLTGLIAGTLTSTQVEQGCIAYDLRRERTYRAFCTGPLDDVRMQHVQRAMTRHDQADGPLLMVPTEGRLVGIVVGLPQSVPDLLIAVGPPTPIEQVATSYATAQDVWQAAAFSGTEGIHTLDDLGWRIAVHQVPTLTDLLRARYLDPLFENGRIGEQIIEALGAHLAHDRSIPGAAAALHVHVNTLRYRLARFEELTGRSLQSTDTIVELAWALHQSGRSS